MPVTNYHYCEIRWQLWFFVYTVVLVVALLDAGIFPDQYCDENLCYYGRRNCFQESSVNAKSLFLVVVIRSNGARQAYRIIRDVILLAETQFDPVWNEQWNSSFCGHMILLLKYAPNEFE
ncbi:hypothetical protein F8M41_018573 [Gigaspora margarita]|uniref:Uncharacterized protein n=1 Tax=Gigaspora margarita TaxID=4874 RepID=A0A8H4ALJ4_GIGMA|nr:hypothetical protein F8M41_018573 [Gigaspora margarita]